MKQFVLISLIFFPKFIAFSVPIDTTIFVSDKEKELILSVIDSVKVDDIKLLTIVNYNSEINIENKLNSYYAETNIGTNITKFKLKSLYKSCHSTFLRKYEEDACFSDIFENGSYNCVSASALFCLIFDHYNIEYEIRETPTHVYLIADPKNSNFLVETTTPTNGIIQFDERFKKNYIEHLHNNKIISDTEFRNKTLDELFKENYLQDKIINLTQLAGIQYYNKGVFLFNEEKYDEALRNFEKSQILYNSEINSFMISNSLLTLFNNEISEKSFHGKNLAKYLNANINNKSAIQTGTEILNSVSNELMINHPDLDKYGEYYNDFNNMLTDSVDRDELNQIFYTFYAFYYYSAYKFDDALSYSIKAYKINPDNIRTKQFISEISLKKLVVDRNHEERIDTIVSYVDQFPFLMENTLLQEFLVYCFSRVIVSDYDDYNPEKSLPKIKRLDELIEKYNIQNPKQEYIELIYFSKAMDFSRNSNFAEAERILRKGLQYAPNSEKMKTSLEMISQANTDVKNKEEKEHLRWSTYYKKTLAKINENKTSINKGVEDYLGGEWITSAYVFNGEEIDFPSEEKFVIKFETPNKVNFRDESENVNSTYSYNPSKCKLTLYKIEDDLNIDILITEISSTHLFGYMYNPGDVEEGVGIVLQSIKQF